MSTKRPDSSNFISWNEEMFKKYDPEAYHAHPWRVIRVVERMRCKAVRRLCDEAGARTVFDIGCGAGNFIPYFDGYDYFAMDISETALSKAAKRGREGVRFLRGNAQELPYKDKSAPCLFSSEVIEHILDPRTFICEMHRVLADDGVAVVTIPNEHLINRIKKLMPGAGKSKDGYAAPDRMDDEWHITEFDAAELRKLIADKFTVTRQVGIPSAIFPVRYVFQLKKIV